MKQMFEEFWTFSTFIVRFGLYSEELSGPIFTKMIQQLVFESTTRSPRSDFIILIFSPGYSRFNKNAVYKSLCLLTYLTE